METLNRTGAVIFMLFLATAAWQDLRKKSVEVRVFVVFGAAAFLWNILIIWYMAGFPGEPETITGWQAVWWGRFSLFWPGQAVEASVQGTDVFSW